jgi:hypothetical protein
MMIFFRPLFAERGIEMLRGEYGSLHGKLIERF